MRIIFENNGLGEYNFNSYLFVEQVKVIKCHHLDEVKGCFAEIEQALADGYYLAGFLSYEASFAFEPVLTNTNKYPFPLLCFGVFKKPQVFSREKLFPYAEYRITDMQLGQNKVKYSANIKRIKRYIRDGDTYQVNFTTKYRFNFAGSPYGLYRDFSRKQPTGYSAFLEMDDMTILSFSPELFFRKYGDKIVVKPMKGTMKRGRNCLEDRQNIQDLSRDMKNCSENLMIVDLLRNDLGKISKTGSVRVQELFGVERYSTLFQMTSTIKSELLPNISYYDLFSALFPSGSVTGAPKVRTMQIIRELEKAPRGIYTGAIGYIEPGGTAVFNVAIRTIVIKGSRVKCQGSRRAEMGIGGGIVWDSDPISEYEECKLKGKFLTEEVRDFKLIETMLFKPGEGIALLDHHLERLKNSAEYFGFSHNRVTIMRALDETISTLSGNDYRIRLLLNSAGEVEVSSEVLLETAADDNHLVVISKHKTDSSDPFLFHKTTKRELYENEYKKYKSMGYIEVLFRNEKGELTEGSRTNLFIMKDGVYYTPPLGCGLLAGVFRGHFMAHNKVMEKVLYEKNLIDADAVYIGNAVRGIRRVISPAPRVC